LSLLPAKILSFVTQVVLFGGVSQRVHGERCELLQDLERSADLLVVRRDLERELRTGLFPD